MSDEGDGYYKDKDRSGSAYVAWPAGLSRDCRAYHVSGRSPVAAGRILELAFDVDGLELRGGGRRGGQWIA